MTLPLGEELRIRSMVYVAAEPVPLFWPMRSFIHHNPLHGLEHLPFERAVSEGERLFRAHGFLPRSVYRRYLADGLVEQDALQKGVQGFLDSRPNSLPLQLVQWLMAELTNPSEPTADTLTLAQAGDVDALLHGGSVVAEPTPSDAVLADRVQRSLLHRPPLYAAFDRLYGTHLGEELDERVIRACLDFFDEGQSVWGMPNRGDGLFAAWLAVAGRDVQRVLGRLADGYEAAQDMQPEQVIARVLQQLEVPESEWVGYLTGELARLHGWAGFIRWRAGNAGYHWQQRHPGDLVDYLALRLLLGLALLHNQARDRLPYTSGALRAAIAADPGQMYLRSELYGGQGHAPMLHQVEEALLRDDPTHRATVLQRYLRRKRADEAQRQAQRLRALAQRAGAEDGLLQLSRDQLWELLQLLRDFRHREGMIWLRAMEAHAIARLHAGLSLAPSAARDKRPFAEALFCIDTRSERIRRHLESVGDYQTYGIAGFFGVPLSFMELGKGSEAHLCPVLLTPRNLVIEMSATEMPDTAALGALDKALHALKESVLTPFVTVEAIGLLFGFDMVGKTLMPATYNRWRSRLQRHKPATHLVLDKLDRERADSIVRAVQRALIVTAVGQEFGLQTEGITDDMVRELREAALGHQTDCPGFVARMEIDAQRLQQFIERLRSAYRINPSFARLQMERLARIGFSLDEQTRFVAQALQSIGLRESFSRFILLVGHGSSSHNNPYESALDCGACGGAHGLVSARVLAQMANRPEVRQRLRAQGIDIPDDAWFVPALHNTTTDEITLHDLERLPPSHLVYLDRLRNGLLAASRLCARERMPTLQPHARVADPAAALRAAQRNAVDWSQVRPEWGLSRNAYFVIGRRALTEGGSLDGRAFLHSYDYRVDPRRRLLENILTGPLVVGQWINMEHYFSTVDNDRFGSGSKVYHNVACRFGVLSGNLSDLRTGLPAQTVLDGGQPYHQPMRLITVIEAPFEHARQAVESVVAVKRLVRNAWIRLLIVDPETATVHCQEDGEWRSQAFAGLSGYIPDQERYSA